MSRSLLRRVATVLTILSVTGVTASCGSSRGGAVSRHPQVTTQLGSLGASSKLDAAALNNIRTSPVPAGVDPQLFEQLRAALLTGVTGRQASAPPSGDANLLDDITFFDNGGGDWTISWTYKNRGDYDLNGEVNVADLTPVGQNYRATPADPNWPTAEAADGDKNGEVNLADVTPIGQHYRAQVGGYNIYGSDSETGPWTLVDSIDRSTGNFGVFPPAFSYHLGTANDPWYLIVPRDFAGVDNVGTGGGGGGATVNLGTTTADTSTTIGTGGGALDGPAGTPVEGIHVEVPTGALAADNQLTLGHNDGTVTPAAGTWSGVLLDLSGPTPLVFDQPVLITAPFTGGASEIPVPYYINPQNQFEVCQTTALDRANGKFTFMTLHTSVYTWFLASSNDLVSDYNVPQFGPATDGFQIVNWGSTYNNRGECFGMSSWTEWYYRYHSADGDFYPRFMQLIGGLTGQDIIATRAFSSISAMWERYTPLMDWSTDPSEQNILIRHAVKTSGAPTNLYIRKADGSGAHAILAYGWISNQLMLCDPNLPPNPSTVRLVAGAWDGYNGNGTYAPPYTEIRNIGIGSILREDYSFILSDAENSFSNTADCLIKDLNINAEDHITTRDITLTGNIDSGQVLIEELEIDTGLSQIKVPVDKLLQNFSVKLPVQNGDNYLQFRTRGYVANGSKVDSPNNFTNTRGLHFFGDLDASTVFITLSWDQAVDLDMYVTDPTNDTAWYSDKVTADGGELDIDVISGYGPEHFTLTTTDTTRFGQPYLIKVHKYSSGNKFTHWTLKVSLNEGPPVTYTGTLTSGDPSNNSPFATGADWGGFIEITPLQPPS
jgi:hypothetical protein